MPNPIRLLAKLTTQSKQIDGMGFGGSTTSTKLDVAAVMGMKHADTKESLDRGAYYVARLYFAMINRAGFTLKLTFLAI
jgi:hypothetical protein